MSGRAGGWGVAALVATVGAASCGGRVSGATLDGGEPAASGGPTAAKLVRPHVPLTTPTEDTIPAGEEGALVRLGRELAANTFERLPENVGSELHCTSCHLNGGTKANAGPWVGVTSIYPTYRDRAGRVISIEERIDECFERSLSGKRLAAGSREQRAFVAYMSWLSRDVPKGSEVDGRGFAKLERPVNFDPDAGQREYAARCASCHGVDGAGRRSAEGAYFAPPLWGPRSFNVAAGMARLDTAAAFVRHNMPLGQDNSLTAWETYDIASYFIAQDRPDYAGKSADWPRGGKPPDARY